MPRFWRRRRQVTGERAFEGMRVRGYMAAHHHMHAPQVKLHALPSASSAALNAMVVGDMVKAGGGQVVRDAKDAVDLVVVGTGVRANDAVVKDARRRGWPCAHAELLVDWLAYPQSLPDIRPSLLFGIPCSEGLGERLEGRGGWQTR